MSLTQISEEEFRALRDLIREKFGINYDDTKQFLLQSRLQTRLIKRSVQTFAAYHRFLLMHADREAEFSELASVLSNNETYFFRERAQLDVLATEVVTEHYRNGGGILKVWSSACSTGEEPFSLAMTLLENKRIPASALQITATDLSPRALEKSALGYYRALSFRATEPQMIQKYFTSHEDGYMISREVKRMVQFSRINLLDENAVAAMGPVDAVFCRNVLIYFDKPTQKKVVEAFGRALKPGGFLFLGHAESIIRMTQMYEPVITPKAIYYRLRAPS